MRLSLQCGFEPGRGFDTPEEYEAGWERFRAQLAEGFNWGKRPQAWWDFDAPELGAQRTHRRPSYWVAFEDPSGILQ